MVSGVRNSVSFLVRIQRLTRWNWLIAPVLVAVAGLPDPRKDHAVAMARFARDILIRMQILTKELEVSLGPDTGDLTLRIGLHSGPVTGGVLRGSRSRFQLFGDVSLKS